LDEEAPVTRSARLWAFVRFAPLVVALLLVATTSTVYGQVLFSSSFDEDDTAFFIYSGPPSGEVAFDPSRGFPTPGSMRLSRGELTNSAVARTNCIDFDPSRRYVFRADSLRDSLGEQCELSYEIFTTSDCSGDLFLGINAVENPDVGVWRPLETFAGTSYLGQEQFRSIRFRMVLFGVEPGACNFDNVLVSVAARIPTLSRTGQLLLLLALPLLGLYLLRSAR
jgi:hypothetical protein